MYQVVAGLGIEITEKAEAILQEHNGNIAHAQELMIRTTTERLRDILSNDPIGGQRVIDDLFGHIDNNGYFAPWIRQVLAAVKDLLQSNSNSTYVIPNT